MATIGETISELLIINNLSANAFGKKIGVSGSIVARWIRENVPLKLTNLLKVAESFGCSVDYICGRTDNRGVFIPGEILFNERLKFFISKSGKSLRQISIQTKLDYRSFYDWRKGTEPLSSTLIILANYFDCSLDSLLGLQNEK